MKGSLMVDSARSVLVGIHVLQSFAEILLPTLWKRGDLQGPFHRTCIIVGISLRDIQASDFGNRDCVWIAGKRLHFIPRADFALADDRKVEARVAACEKALHHVIHLKSHPELVAGKPRLPYEYLRQTN